MHHPRPLRRPFSRIPPDAVDRRERDLDRVLGVEQRVLLHALPNRVQDFVHVRRDADQHVHVDVYRNVGGVRVVVVLAVQAGDRVRASDARTEELDRASLLVHFDRVEESAPRRRHRDRLAGDGDRD